MKWKVQTESNMGVNAYCLSQLYKCQRMNGMYIVHILLSLSLLLTFSSVSFSVAQAVATEHGESLDLLNEAVLLTSDPHTCGNAMSA